MNRIKALVAAAGMCVGLGTASVPSAGSAAAPPILSGCEYDYAPFCLVRDDETADGFSVALLQAALDAVGLDVQFKTGAWAEIKQDLVEGRIQALPLVARSPEREQDFDFTFPYLTMHGTIVVREDTTDIRGPQDLRGKRVAVLREDVAHEYLRNAELGASIVPLSSFAVAMRGLSGGQYDAVVIQKLLAYQLMRELELGNLRTVGRPLEGYTQILCFAVRKGDSRLLSLLNEGLSIVMADGTFRRLHAEWFADLGTVEPSRSRISVGGDANFPPYEFIGEHGQPTGYNVDLTRAIARRMGLSVDIRLAPWKQVRARLDRGDIDAVHGMFYSAERDAAFDFSQPHAVIQHVAVVRRGAQPVSGMSSLAGRSILVMAGDIMHDLTVQHGLEAQVVEVASQEEALNRLAAGEGDCALVARVPALYWIEKHGWSNLVVSGEALHTAEYCYAVPHGKEPLLSVFAEGLAALKQTGEYREIQTRWLAPYDEAPVGFGTVLTYATWSLIPVLVILIGSYGWTRALRAKVRQQTAELREANQALLESENRLRLAIDAAYLVSFEWDIKRNEVRRFASVDPSLPLTPEGDATSVEEVRDLVHPDDRELFSQNLEAALARDDGEYTSEFRVFGSGGLVRWLFERGKVERDEEGQPIRLIGLSQDITERKWAEQALRDSEQRLRRAQEIAHLGSWELDLTTGELTWSNEVFRIMGFQRCDFLPSYEGFLERVHPDDRAGVDAAYRNSVSNNQDGYEIEHRIIRRNDGEIRHVHERCQHMRGADGAIVRSMGMVHDITERKQAEEAIKASLEEKNVLLKEIHHRVKNNLQVISSLVSLQAETVRDPVLREVFGDIQDRVRSMALVHEQLYHRANLAEVDFAEYASSLLHYLLRAHRAASVKLTLDVQPLALSVELAVPLGLILNELAANALKHAFENREGGQLGLRLEQDAEGGVSMTVSDDGMGLPPDFDWRESPSLGLRLVQMLSVQVDATVEVQRPTGGGTIFRVRMAGPRRSDDEGAAPVRPGAVT